jgi:hypothetical protein
MWRDAGIPICAINAICWRNGMEKVPFRFFCVEKSAKRLSDLRLSVFLCSLIRNNNIKTKSFITCGSFKDARWLRKNRRTHKKQQRYFHLSISLIVPFLADVVEKAANLQCLSNFWYCHTFRSLFYTYQNEYFNVSTPASTQIIQDMYKVDRTDFWSGTTVAVGLSGQTKEWFVS